MLFILLWYTFLNKFLITFFIQRSVLCSLVQSTTEQEDHFELPARDFFQCVLSSISEEQNWKLAFRTLYKLSIQTAAFPTTCIPYGKQKTIRPYDWRNYRFKKYWTHRAALLVKETIFHFVLYSRKDLLIQSLLKKNSTESNTAWQKVSSETPATGRLRKIV
jgi:hypothetical protein